ncbi:hypothetical protein, partial [Streptomyces thermogriseus]
TFGTLLSSQGTDASFVLTLTGLSSGRFPSVFLTLSDLFDPIFLDAFQVHAFALPFLAAPTLPELLSRSDRLPFRCVGRSFFTMTLSSIFRSG